MSATAAPKRTPRRAAAGTPVRRDRGAGRPVTMGEPPTPPAPPAVSLEESARRTLAWGAGSLILGLAVVGAGSDDLGMLPVLAGLFLTIYGIHKYGRLGPEDDGDGAAGDGAGTLDAARA